MGMRQAIHLNHLQIRRGTPQTRSLASTVSMCRKVGFQYFDYLPDDFSSTTADREIFDSLGAKVIQSHCPFFRYENDGLSLFRKIAPQAVKSAALLGAEFFVIHADEYRIDNDMTFDEILKITCEYLAPVIDLCGEYGLTPAIGNLFEEKGRNNRTRFCSETEDVIAIIESFPGSGIGCCWDSGHHHVSFGRELFFDKLEELAPYIVCTHLHDNYSFRDMHNPAFVGSIEWEKVMSVLKKYHYQGVLNWEFAHGTFPDEIYEVYLNLIKVSGDYLLKLL